MQGTDAQARRRVVPPPRGEVAPPADPGKHGEVMTHHALGASSGMWGAIVFIASEVMFFAALFTAYFYLRVQSPEWAPEIGHRPGAFPFTAGPDEILPTINTIVLVASSVVLQVGMNRLKAGDRQTFIRLLAITIVMGVVFLAGQGYEYYLLATQDLLPTSGLFGAVFFTLTGFHGAHVAGGVIFMLVVLLRARMGQFDQHRHLAPEAASLYWHFVDVVWIALFFSIYIF